MCSSHGSGGKLRFRNRRCLPVVSLLLPLGLAILAACSRPAEPGAATSLIELYPVAESTVEDTSGESVRPRVERDERFEALVLPFRTSVTYYLRIPKGGSLVAEGVLPWGAARGAARADGEPFVRVGVATGDGSQEEHYRLVPSRPPKSGDAIPLPATPEPIRITFEAEADGLAYSGPAGLRLIHPIVRGTLIGFEPADFETAPRPHATRPDILIYLVDTLRADHLGCYGYEKPTSPNVDAFAREATLFSSARAHSSWTRPAVASIFTGLEPRLHGTNARKDGLSDSLALLPTLLHDVGYATAAFVGNGNVSQSIGFDRGFEHFEWHPSDQEQLRGMSAEITDATLRWLADRSDPRPLLLYVHTIDPHEPYVGMQPTAEKVRPVPREVFKELKERKKTPSPQLTADLVTLYDRDIAFNDAQFGRLLSELKDLKLYDPMLIVFLSDHGEEFFDHQGWSHGSTLFEEQLHIPLIIKLPGGLGRGKTADEVARQIDVLPTILDYLDAPRPPRLQGRSLLPDILGDRAAERSTPTFAYLELDGQQIESVTVDGKKLIHHAISRYGRPEIEFYDLTLDPGERTDLAHSQPIWTGYLRSVLAFRREQSGPEVVAPEASIDKDLRANLLALGYLE